MGWSILAPVRRARNAVPSFAIALLLALVTSLAACGGGSAASDTTAEAETPEDDADDATAGVGGSSTDKEWRGWRWKGKRSACFFRHRNSCYDKLEAACRAARCGEARCTHSEGVPAVVSCRK